MCSRAFDPLPFLSEANPWVDLLGGMVPREEDSARVDFDRTDVEVKQTGLVLP